MEELLGGTIGPDPPPYARGRVGSYAAHLVGRGQQRPALAGGSETPPCQERLYQHGISPTPLCPIGCGGEETVEHTLWSCPIEARFWRRVSEWWSAEEGAGRDRDLVLYGRGLKRMGPETANLLWQAVSVA
ncbi:hypothetical protein QTP86_009513, partial [Hemibagrus guttatus]